MRSSAAKRTMLGVISILTLAIASPMSIGHAADLGVKPPPALPVPPVPSYYNWTGFYIGGNFGGGWARDDISGTTLSTTALGTLSSTFSSGHNYGGVLGGGQIGANYQFARDWVIGLEADADWSGLSGATGICSSTAGVVVGCSGGKTKVTDFGTVRGRLGYAWNNVLLFGTGGWAWAQSSTTSALNCAVFSAGTFCPGGSDAFTGGSSSASATAYGWTAGAGLEWAFTNNWTARIEYLHLQFNGISESLTSAGAISAAVVPFTSTNSASTNSGIDIARVGVNYIFK